MINEINAKKFCCEDISLIENFIKASLDKTQIWHCHHRMETDKCLTRKQLVKMKLYYKRPASELIFLTQDEHIRIHRKGKPRSQETRNKISESLKGQKFTIERCAKISAAIKGKKKPPLKKYKWITPDGEIKIMSVSNASRWHPDWIKLSD